MTSRVTTNTYMKVIYLETVTEVKPPFNEQSLDEILINHPFSEDQKGSINTKMTEQ